MLLCGGGRLAEYREGWERVPCPLACPELLAVSGPRLACVDNANHALWMGGRMVAAESGIEAALWWHDCLLTLSGDTDCLTLIGPGGEMLLTTPAGIYHQDMCLLPGGNTVAVAGGATHLVVGRPILAAADPVAAARAIRAEMDIPRYAH